MEDEKTLMVEFSEWFSKFKKSLEDFNDEIEKEEQLSYYEVFGKDILK